MGDHPLRCLLYFERQVAERAQQAVGDIRIRFVDLVNQEGRSRERRQCTPSGVGRLDPVLLLARRQRIEGPLERTRHDVATPIGRQPSELRIVKPLQQVSRPQQVASLCASSNDRLEVFAQTERGSATGIGDIVVRGKYLFWEMPGGRGGLAAGLDWRYRPVTKQTCWAWAELRRRSTS